MILHPLNALLMIALGIGLGVWLTRRYQLGWRLWGIGAATFILSQVGHIPFNSGVTALFQAGVLPTPPPAWQLPFNAVFLGLSAGVFEEVARYLTMRFWAKDVRTYGRALLLGAGHGGIEAIILGGLVLVTFFSMVGAQNQDLSASLPPELLAQAQAQIAAYWSTPAPMVLLGALERSFTLIHHIAWSVVVMQVFTRRQWRWLGLAIVWHAAVDAIAVYVNTIYGPLVTEAVIAVLTLLPLAALYLLHTPEPAPEAITPLTPPATAADLIFQADDDLDASRYHTD
jgi:uncharacterized membrane protein YhfC